MERQSGLLYVVATPIGNLGDMTDRARKVLTDVALIAAEDTRDTGRLLKLFAISTPLTAYHDHNEQAVTPRLVDHLLSGRDLALVSDAGTPLISDPGYRLVRAAREHGISVVPIPGPSAAICALSAAGLPSDRFLFLGFPPRGRARRAWLESGAAEPGTLVIYESPKRAVETLGDIESVLGERQVVVARELTKRFETFLTGTAAALAERIASDPEQRLGELVILVEGAGETGADLAEQERVLRLLAAELPLKRAAALASEITGGKKNALYRLALELGLGG